MLYDKDFLLKLDKSKDKTIYARVTALTFKEAPIENIEGRVTGGSINLDGASSLRRTCSLTMVANDLNINNYLWGLNTKFKLEIGVQNTVDPTMPDIIWFNEGIYLITTFNTSRSTNDFSISISGKDKMCLLNGEVGGTLESSVDFGCIEEEDKNGIWTIKKIPIQEIIRNAVHTYAGEPYWNIVINDLDTYGLELLEYRYDTPMYLYRNPNSDIFHNVIMENDYTKVQINGVDKLLSEIPSSHLDVLVDSLTGAESNPEYVYFNNKPYIFAKVEYGQTVGYRTTDLVYAGDLIANVGESITSVLDKIKNMLSEFEYFYDTNGTFIFQKKKSFTSTMWTPLKQDDEEGGYLEESLALLSATAYQFSGSELIVSFNNNPNLMNLRNDFSIWGERTGVSGAAIPVHMRYAIDTKPISYQQMYFDPNDPDYAENSFAIQQYNERYGTTLEMRSKADAKLFTADNTDWREVLYQMALDYYKYNMIDNFELVLGRQNPQYPTGQTGYERYYIDLQGFWRQLYNPELLDKINNVESKLNAAIATVNDITQEIALKQQAIRNDNSDLQSRQDLASLQKNLRPAEIEVDNLTIKLDNYKKDKANYYYLLTQDEWNNLLEDDEMKQYASYEEYCKMEFDADRMYYNRNMFEHPELLNFWFDFLDTEGELSSFNVQTVGSRSKVVNDSNIKSIYFRRTPAVIFTKNLNTERMLAGYRYIQVPESMVEQMFSISAQGKSAKDRLDELLYQHSYCIESVSITTIPIYYLEPNTRINIYDEETNINGDYVVSKITLPLTYNGTMSITATKAATQV